MAKTISKLEEGLLSVNHVLYKILKSSNAPVWWKKVKKDKELYIEIRKKNIIDVYYRGGRMAELISHLLAMGDRVEVLEPVELREEMKERINSMLNVYK